MVPKQSSSVSLTLTSCRTGPATSRTTNKAPKVRLDLKIRSHLWSYPGTFCAPAAHPPRPPPHPSETRNHGLTEAENTAAVRTNVGFGRHPVRAESGGRGGAVVIGLLDGELESGALGLVGFQLGDSAFRLGLSDRRLPLTQGVSCLRAAGSAVPLRVPWRSRCQAVAQFTMGCLLARSPFGDS